MKSIALRFYFAITLIFAFSSAAAERVPASTPQDTTITLAALQFPPYAYTEAGSDECVGYTVKLTKMIFNAKGYNVKAICAPAIRVYRMIESGEVDLTVNIKSTKLLKDTVDFIEPPFGSLDLIFLSHENEGFENMVSGIRGFDYNGHRQLLVEQGYTFQDTPGSIDAIKMFMRGRTRHLITYKAPYRFYLEQNSFDIPKGVSAKSLMSLPTFFAVSLKSKNKDLIKQVFEEHSEATQATRFDELLPIY
ncbi:transporter substrate-binding domain-containing protein [Alteromonas facilis]|uniref:transporter substrate-binding domain-containing protein n=1 Tax=Alteromonas facilis TaxID=2048004 RepID=UPI000C295364|nr:transporter substrate-binding domain-containing protein [Alteromonas facilis]